MILPPKISPLMKEFHDFTEHKYSYLRLSKGVLHIDTKRLEMTLTYPADTDISIHIPSINSAMRKVLELSLIEPEISYRKSHFDNNHFLTEICDFFAGYPAISSVFKDKMVNFTALEDRRTLVTITLPKTYCTYAEDEALAEKLMQYAYNNYCDEVEVVFAASDDTFEDFSAMQPEVVMQESRVICVKFLDYYVGLNSDDTAAYISDIKSERTFVTLCGHVRNPQKLEKKNKTGDPVKDNFFKFVLEDYTGTISCLIFPNAKTHQRLCDLSAGTDIICSGQVKKDVYNGKESLTFWVRDISLCELPKNFTPHVTMKPVPKSYSVVEISKAAHASQLSLIEPANVPEYLNRNTFVVFDIETTGLSPRDCDIIEIGAVKISGGRIVEEFSTFVNPLKPIPQEITDLTTITDADVMSAPLIDAVIADFVLFCDGAILVAHNIDFDYSFVSASARANGYVLNNEQLDTIALAKRVLTDLRLFNLNALCSHLGVVNAGAHRAVYDAYATAECFLILEQKAALKKK